MTDVARITAPPESFTSTTTAPDYQRSSHSEEIKLEPSDNREPESSPTRSGAGDTQASSADEGKNQDATQRAGPSMTVSGASSVSGNGTIASSLGPHFSQPLTAKKGPQSFFSGSKIKHLKKQDGIPLWRADIQYDFLQAVFKDDEAVFSNSYTGERNLSFADIYVDAMARSSKTSKILRDKLLTERSNALNMAMVCLLVNVGRMNTTLNFFPEMKAQLRTYHAIPSLQAHTDSSAYKQLQDAPRLKSILKGACEDRKEPQTLDQIMGQKAPRTNPINLVFILSTYAPKISEMHFPENMDFYDLIMRATLSSKSRAKCFLWLMWLYLESDFSEKACLENPYGKGKSTKNDTIPWCVPDFEYLTEEQAAKENVDTEVEKEFGEQKRQERKRLLGDIQNAPPGVGRGRGRKSTAIAASPDMQSPGVSPQPSRRRTHPRQGFPEAYEYESEPQTRSGSPESTFQTPANGNKGNRRISSNVVKIPNILNVGEFASSPMDVPSSIKHKGGRPKASTKRTADGELKPAQRIILKSGGKQLATPESVGYGLTASRSILPSDRSSPMLERLPRHRMTSHQMAVQQNRQERVEYIIGRKLRRLDTKKRRMRIKKGAIFRAWTRIKDVEEPLYMSDDDSRPLTYLKNTDVGGDTVEKQGQDDGSHPAKRAKIDKGLQSKGLIEKSRIGPAGLLPRDKEENGDDDDDFGEEAMSLAAALRRSRRRMERWEEEDRRRAAAGFALVDEPRLAPEQTVSGLSAADQVEQNACVVTEEEDNDEEMPEAAREEEESDEDVEME